MPQHRRIREYAPRSYFLLLIDTLTLFPLNALYYLFCYINDEMLVMNLYFVRWARTKCLVRLYRVCEYSFKIQNQVGRNQIFAIWLAHFVLVALLVHGFGAVWYTMSCYRCEKKNWALFLDRYHIFNAKSVLEWFLVSVSTIGTVLQHCYRGD